MGFDRASFLVAAGGAAVGLAAQHPPHPLHHLAAAAAGRQDHGEERGAEDACPTLFEAEDHKVGES